MIGNVGGDFLGRISQAMQQFQQQRPPGMGGLNYPMGSPTGGGLGGNNQVWQNIMQLIQRLRAGGPSRPGGSREDWRGPLYGVQDAYGSYYGAAPGTGSGFRAGYGPAPAPGSGTGFRSGYGIGRPQVYETGIRAVSPIDPNIGGVPPGQLPFDSAHHGGYDVNPRTGFRAGYQY